MVQTLTRLTGALLWWTGLVLSRKVHQSPTELVKDSGDSMQLNCSHAIPSYNNILWYHQAAGHSALCSSTMFQVLTRLTGALLWWTGLVLSRKVHQSPAELVKDSGDSMQLNCSHDIPSYRIILCVHQSPSTLLNHTGESVQLSCSHNILNYDTILWYQQPQQGNGMKLIGRVTYKNVELEGEKRFNMSGDGERQAFLHIDKLALTDSAVYLCAAWITQC
ncbi:hypothetical protein SKAU_G00332050 [Synaphobranchus kaupii]|uniref:Ig-like domain-containing protein n=1 Tax=Synaphobranchus kaupii TaxID=118154 RepID=A0A9Q1ELD5_SYNKA|nr:hypothetical protein SKAU_G00332050 [Synaphobranchus kaupii]